MDIHPRLSLVAAVLLAFALAACGDDDGTGTPNDTTPPSVSSVTPIDDHNIDIRFNERVTEASAENEGNYTILEAATPSPVSRGMNAAPGDPLTIAGATLKNDDQTVTVTTQESMAGLNFDLSVHNVSDVTGNVIGEGGSGKSFTGSNTIDETPPSVVSHAPLANGTNISINATVVVHYSEAIQSASSLWFAGPGAGVASGNLPASAQGGVSFSQNIDGSTLTLTLNTPLAYSQLYTVTVNATDFAGNPSGTTQWSFTTSANTDHTPPTLVSTVPANLAAGVDVNADLSLTFSEAIDQSDFTVELVPDPGDGVATWSNGGKTVTFNPTAALLDDTQYTFTIFPNGVFDLAGNGIDGVHTVQFTTATTLAAGSIGGTVTGDAGSGANDPTGAQLIVADGNPFNSVVSIFGSGTVAGNNTYNVLYLPDNLYYVITVMDTNHDGDLDPSTGDAVGGFGVDVPNGDLDPDGIAVDGGAHVTGKNFAMYDPSTASGNVTYNGIFDGSAAVYVGLFDTAGFSPDATPVFGIATLGPDFAWSFNTAEGLFPEGDYYVGAFMDVTAPFGEYQPAFEPAGFYGGLPGPTVVHLSNGTDVHGIAFEVVDVPGVPSPSSITSSVIWPKAKHNAAFQRLVDFVRQSQQQASR